MRRLGDILIELGFVTQQSLDEALRLQRLDRRRVGEILVSMGAVTEDKLARVLSRQLGIELWEPARMQVHPRVIDSFPSELALEHRVFPVGVRRQAVGLCWYLATSDPTDDVRRGTLENALCTPEEPVEVTWLVATSAQIEDALSVHYAVSVCEPEPIPLPLSAIIDASPVADFDRTITSSSPTIARIELTSTVIPPPAPFLASQENWADLLDG